MKTASALIIAAVLIVIIYFVGWGIPRYRAYQVELIRKSNEQIEQVRKETEKGNQKIDQAVKDAKAWEAAQEEREQSRIADIIANSPNYGPGSRDRNVRGTRPRIRSRRRR